MSKKRFCVLLAALYAAAVLLGGGALLGRSRQRAACVPAALSVTDAVYGSIRDDHPAQWMGYGPGSLVSTDNDPQLVWVVEQPVSGLQMTIRSSQPIQDPELYYTLAAGQGYVPEQKLKPVQSDPAQGVYVFQLPRAQWVYALRLDPTNAAGAFFELTEVTLNPPQASREPLGAAQVLAVLVLPGLAALALRELAEWKKR